MDKLTSKELNLGLKGPTTFNKKDLINYIKGYLTYRDTEKPTPKPWPPPTEVYQGSNLELIVDEMFNHMKFQIESPALINSRFRLGRVLSFVVNFHWLNLTRGSSFLELPESLAKKSVIVNPQNDDEECFKWAIITVLDIVRTFIGCQILGNSRKITIGLD